MSVHHTDYLTSELRRFELSPRKCFHFNLQMQKKNSIFLCSSFFRTINTGEIIRGMKGKATEALVQTRLNSYIM